MFLGASFDSALQQPSSDSESVSEQTWTDKTLSESEEGCRKAPSKDVLISDKF